MKIDFKLKISKIGGSLGIIFPRKFLEDFDLKRIDKEKQLGLFILNHDTLVIKKMYNDFENNNIIKKDIKDLKPYQIKEIKEQEFIEQLIEEAKFKVIKHRGIKDCINKEINYKRRWLHTELTSYHDKQYDIELFALEGSPIKGYVIVNRVCRYIIAYDLFGKILKKWNIDEEILFRKVNKNEIDIEENYEHD